MTRIRLLTLAACFLCGGLLGAARHCPAASQPQPRSQPITEAQPDRKIAVPIPPARPPEPGLASPPEAEAYPPLVRFGDARLRHTAPVMSLALTPDGSRLLTATRAEPVLRLWDVKTARLLRAVRVEEELTASMTVVAITPDARRAFVIRHQSRQRDRENQWHELATVDLATGAVERWPLGSTSEDPHPIFTLSADGKTLAGIIGGEVRVWDFASGAQRVLGDIPKWHADVGSICFSPDGTQVAACRSRGAFFLAPVNGNGPLQRIPVKCHDNDVCAVFWHQPNRVVALWRSGLAAFDPTTGVEIARGGELEGDADLIPAQAGGGKLFLKEGPATSLATCDLTTLARIPDRVYPPWRGELFAVSADGRILAVATGHAVRLFDPRTGTPLHPDLERAPFEPLARLQISPKGACLLGCTADTAHAWELSDGRTRAAFGGWSWLMTCSALSPDGRLASGGLSKAGCPLVAELQSGRAFPLPTNQKTRHAPEIIGFTGPNRVWLWNRPTNTCAPFEIDTNRMGAAVPGFAYAQFVAVSPDGRKLAAIGLDGLAIRDLGSDRGWEVLETLEKRVKRPRRKQGESPSDARVRFSPCGRWLLVHDTGLELWDLRNKPMRVEPFESARWTGSEGGFSPDGRFFAGAVWARDGGTDLCVFETVSGGEVYRFHPARGAVGCTFTPDGCLLVIAHNDTTLSVWDRAGVESRHCGTVPAGEEWRWLGSRDAKHAHAAVRALVANPERAMVVLAPVFAPPDAALPKRLITELGDEKFRVRERAERELAEMGMSAKPALLAAVTTADSPEVRERAAALLKALRATNGQFAVQQLRAVRAVEILERIASPEAKALLATCAATDPNSDLAAEVNAARGRLGKSGK